MAQINRFEDLPIWRKAREIAGQVYGMTESGRFAQDPGLSDQVRRAAVSVMSNIAEGFERATNKDFVRFLSISKASLAEVRSQFYLATDLKYIDQHVQEQLNQKMADLGYEIGGFIRYLQKTPPPAKAG